METAFKYFDRKSQKNKSTKIRSRPLLPQKRWQTFPQTLVKQDGSGIFRRLWHTTSWNKMAGFPYIVKQDGGICRRLWSTQAHETRWRIFLLPLEHAIWWNKMEDFPVDYRAVSTQPRETRWRIFLLTIEHKTSWNKMADFPVAFRARNLVKQDGRFSCWL